MNPGTVRIEVRIEDITGGRPHQPRGCAMARAARRALGILPLGDDDLVVSQASVILDRGGRRYEAYGDAGFRTFITAFDRAERVEPAAFDLTFCELDLADPER